MVSSERAWAFGISGADSSFVSLLSSRSYMWFGLSFLCTASISNTSAETQDIGVEFFCLSIYVGREACVSVDQCCTMRCLSAVSHDIHLVIIGTTPQRQEHKSLLCFSFVFYILAVERWRGRSHMLWLASVSLFCVCGRGVRPAPQKGRFWLVFLPFCAPSPARWRTVQELLLSFFFSYTCVSEIKENVISRLWFLSFVFSVYMRSWDLSDAAGRFIAPFLCVSFFLYMLEFATGVEMMCLAARSPLSFVSYICSGEGKGKAGRGCGSRSLAQSVSGAGLAECSCLALRPLQLRPPVNALYIAEGPSKTTMSFSLRRTPLMRPMLMAAMRNHQTFSPPASCAIFSKSSERNMHATASHINRATDTS